MSDDKIKDLFNADYRSFGKQSSIKRVVSSTDFSQLTSPAVPITEHFAPGSKLHQKDFSSELEYSTVSMSDPKVELIEKAKESLDKALEHANKDVVIKNALEAILKSYEEKIDDYKSEHPIPGEEPYQELQDPEWSRLSKSAYKPLSRVGNPPKDEISPVLEEIRLKIKALESGMTLSDINNADSVLDRVFVSSGGIRKKF